VVFPWVRGRNPLSGLSLQILTYTTASTSPIRDIDKRDVLTSCLVHFVQYFLHDFYNAVSDMVA